jgi:hypothetical protein
MMLCETDVREITFDEIFDEICKRNWCDGTLTRSTLSEVLNENYKMFNIVNKVYTLSDYGVISALKVDFE